MNLLESASGFVQRHLSPRHATALRNLYLATKHRLEPLSKRIYGTFDTPALRQHLEQRVGQDFEILMVHGSINHMLPMYTGNPVELVRMLEDFVGPDRTLVMPAFFFGDPKIGDVNETFRTNPRFNLKRTPSQMGLFTEIFRRGKGVLQSRHPVYRVSAKGPMAAALVRGHEQAQRPAGIGTPFEFMAEHNTKVLGIGKSYHVMTQVHHVDDLLGEDFPVPRRPVQERSVVDVTVIDGDEEIPLTLRGNGITWRFNIDRLPSLLQPGDLEYWRFHHVPMFCGSAGRVTRSLVEAARQGKCIYDPT
jgi:aminoglycoside 3-N-acetyltransferase